ncbi:MAG: hypothetical protein NC548_59835, partial [Lachnospiraceae bacterium]|nr:hypothetical protein [Lachnospiraceae bacterium]
MYGVTADKINEMVSAGKIGFADVEKVLNKMTDAGGQFYNLMEKQSASLTGQISNLEDAWDNVLNSWGEANQDLFAGAISSATYLVEHMDTIVRVLKAVAVGYGSVKAAIILNNIATKSATGIAVIDNTIRSAKLALMKAEAALTGTAIAQKKALTAAEEAHFTAMEATLTAEQQANILNSVRVAAIQSLLTAQQQQYLSTINLTTSSVGYEAVAMAMLTADQRLALSKIDLTTKGAAYRAAIMQEVTAKQASQAASLESMRITVKEAAVAVEAAKSKAIAANQAVEAARYEVYWAQQSGNATAIAAAQKRLDAAVDQQKITRTAALAAQSDFYTKKKQLETLATQQGRAASVADTAAKTAQTAATNVLSAATGKLSAGLKALWATMVANPIGAILSLVGLLVSAFMMLGDSEDDAAENMKKFGDSSESQLSNLQMLLAVLQNTDKNSSTYKKAFEELNAVLRENGLEALSASASIDEVREAYERLTEAVKRNSAETERGNALANVREQYDKELDEIGKTIEKELKGAHHYNWSDFWGVGYSTDSDDIQSKATALSGQIRGVIEDALPEMVNLSDTEKAAAKQRLRDQITDIMTAAGIDKQHAQFITDYSFLDDAFYDVFSEDGGIIDQAIKARQAFDEQTTAANQAADAIAGMADSAAETPEKIDIATLSIEQLDDLLGQMQGAEVHVDFTQYGYDSLMAMINAVNNAIGEKQNNLNTENGINSEIQRLKQKRGDTDINSQDYNDLTAQIEALQGKLPSSKKQAQSKAKQQRDNTARNNAALIKAQREADWKLEEARISTLEEGYEKRRATLDLQLKKELQRIDDEEKALEEARKNAGKGGLSQEEKNDFTAQRKYAQQNYNRDAAKVFDGELDYKRKQYELYWRWVENMGKDIADRQFADLLQSGGSYKEYIEKQIADLKGKPAGSLTDAEKNFLITLNVQYDELTGAKTALEAFKQTVSDTIGRSQTLAEKLEAVAKLKAQLENGESGIVSDDDRVAASLELSQQEADLQKQVHETVLNDYRSFEEQRQSITKEYALLRTEAERMGDEERVRLINKAEQEALSALNTGFLQQSDSWKKLFSDLDTLSVGQIQKLVNDIDSQLAAGTLKLSPVDYKAVIDSLNQAKARIQELNPFAALDTFFNDYLKARKKLAAAKAALAKGEGSKEDVEAAERE